MEDLLLQALTYSAIIWVAVSLTKRVLEYFRLFSLSNVICLKCVTFYLTLLLTFNLQVAAVSALMAAIIDNYVNVTRL
jgi:hypothetical protein